QLKCVRPTSGAIGSSTVHTLFSFWFWSESKFAKSHLYYFCVLAKNKKALSINECLHSLRRILDLEILHYEIIMSCYKLCTSVAIFMAASLTNASILFYRKINCDGNNRLH